MKWILIVVGGLAGVVGLVALVGLFLPREHRATCRASYQASPEAVFGVLTDYVGYARWRPDVKSARIAATIGGRPVIVEETGDGPLTYSVEESESPRKLVLRVADADLPYGGTWTYELAPEGSGTRLTVTEDGFVKNVIFRALARFVFGHHATMEQTLAALGTSFGESVSVERVP